MPLSAAAGIALGRVALSLVGGLFQKSRAASIYDTQESAYRSLLGMYGQNVEQEAGLQDAQASIALDEAGRTAAIKARDVKDFQDEQLLRYTKSGVLLEGSPIDALNETRRRGQEEIDAIMKSGAARSDLMRRAALLTRNTGRAQLLGSLMDFQTKKAQTQMEGARGSNNLLLGALSGLGDLFSSTRLSGRQALLNTVQPPGPAPDPTVLLQPYGKMKLPSR